MAPDEVRCCGVWVGVVQRLRRVGWMKRVGRVGASEKWVSSCGGGAQGGAMKGGELGERALGGHAMECV